MRFDSNTSPPWGETLKAVSFDLDHTLWELDHVIAEATRLAEALLLQRLPELAPAMTRDALFARGHAIKADRPELINDKSMFRQTLYRELVLEHGGHAAIAEDAYALFYQERSRVELFPGVRQMLDALRSNHRLIAITNGNVNLAQVGIEDCFDQILHASIDHPSKPSSSMFNSALKAQGLQPHEMVHVGDNAYADVYGAQRAGVYTVWYNERAEDWPPGLQPPDVEVRSIAELSSALLHY